MNIQMDNGIMYTTINITLSDVHIISYPTQTCTVILKNEKKNNKNQSFSTK